MSLAESTLGASLDLGPDVLVQRLVADRAMDLARALRVAQSQGLPGEANTYRLAWAVGHLAMERRQDRPRGCFRNIALEDPFAKAWDALTTSLDADGTTYLSELAWSVMCEKRDDWQPPDDSSLDAGDADAAFAMLYGRLGDKVQAYINREAPDADTATEIAIQAWGNAYSAYWSPDARTRFGGSSQISTLMITIARNLLIAHKPPEAVEIDFDQVSAEMGTQVAQNDIQGAYQECLEVLSDRQRLITDQVLNQGIQQKEVAAAFNVSAPYINKVLKQAKAGLADCLAGKGFGDA